MFSEDVTFFVYLGYLSLAWGLIFAAALLMARFVKTWLITALVNFHAMRGDMADEARDSISSEEVTVGHWGNVMPPVIRGNLVPSNAVTAIQRSQSQPSRLAQVPTPPLPPDPPPLYEEVVDGLPSNDKREPRKSSTVSSQSEVPPPLYWDLYPTTLSPDSSLLCVLPASAGPGSPQTARSGRSSRRASQSLEKLPPPPPSPHTHSDKGGK